MSDSTVKLPPLPGYKFDSPKGRNGRGGAFQSKNGYILPKLTPSTSQNQPDIQDEDGDLDELINKTIKLTYGNSKQSQDTQQQAKTVRVPAHIALDKKVLTFSAYFEQEIFESADEKKRIRYVKIYYHLEDDTMAILEPKIQNSGLPQGKLVKRQRLPKDRFGNFFTWEDLHIGEEVVIYGIKYHICSCDAFTRDFYLDSGVEQGENVDLPQDEYTLKRQVKDTPAIEREAPDDFDRLRQFLVFDRKVLRFYAIWDNTSVEGGEKRPYIVLYFLVDDTVEVRECHEANDGHDPFPFLLRRQKLPLNPKQVSEDFPTICMNPNRHDEVDFVSAQDLRVGGTINVLGRSLFLHDCDDFTRQFYQENFGEEFQSIPITSAPPTAPKKELPPHSGFGSAEDAVQSVMALRPKPPKKKIDKLLKYNNQSLRFSAKIVTDYEPDAERNFVLSYKLANDTISVFEPKSRITRGGKFLEACKVPLPGTSKHMPEYYGPFDLYVGAIVVAFGRKFELTDCDEWVFEFASENKSCYTEEAYQSICKATGHDDMPVVVDHTDQSNDLQDQVGLVLSMENFENYDQLQREFISADNERSGFCSDIDAESILLSITPLSEDLCQAVVDQFSENGVVAYNDLIDFLAA